jgi:glutamate synthase (ferredoxin)
LISKLLKKLYHRSTEKRKQEFFKIKNTDRSVGAILSNEISKFTEHKVYPKIQFWWILKVQQSFGAFATNGLSFKIHGNCNDYLGKGLSEENLL